MAISRAQELLEIFHSQPGPHAHMGMGGDNPFDAHFQWHERNTGPPLPHDTPAETWGADCEFGTLFLQMHSEMVAGLKTWYEARNEPFPQEWNPQEEIPEALSYTARPEVFPQAIQKVFEARAALLGETPVALLTRNVPANSFVLPPHYLEAGGEGSADFYTGVSKLGDFINTNQLGCCLAIPHAFWHIAIGGAMSASETAIADPIFYWGVHLQIDRIYQNYLRIESQKDALSDFVRKANPTQMSPEVFAEKRAADMQALRSFGSGFRGAQYPA